jgi:MFS transporter, DHA1 family, multidrug resistance protein
MTKKSSEIEVTKDMKVFMFLLVLFISIGMFVNYMYFPAMPRIAKYLSVSDGIVAKSVSASFIGYAISQIFFGTISDSFGRKKPLLVGITIIMIGIIMAITATSINQLIIARFIQGLDLGSTSVLYRIMLKDYFPKSILGWAVSTLVTFTALIPAFAPFLGGVILIIFTWKILFVILLIYTLIGFIVLKLYLPETLPKKERIPFNCKNILSGYTSLLKNRSYLRYAICIISSYACLTLYITATPFIYQIQFSLSPAEYGTLITIPTLALFGGGKISAVLHKKNISLNKIILYGIIIITASSLLLTFAKYLSINNYWMITGLITIEALGISFAYINATAGMLNKLPKTSGPGVALSGFLQMAGSGIIIFFASSTHIDTSFVLGIATVICSLIALLSISKIRFFREIR